MVARMFGVRELARMLDVRPPRISYALYHDFSEQEIPLIGGRRIIPEAMVPRVADRLRARGVEVRGAIPTIT